MKIVFAGTPPFAARALQSLSEAGHDVVLVLTQPDRPSGRGLRIQPSAVKAFAERRGIPVAQPLGLRIGGRYDADARATHALLASTPHDAVVVAAYGLILPPSVLSIPPRGSLNIHASLLPRWRGAAPVQRAIEAGDTETGITIMQMDAGLDTGDVLLSRKIAIDDADTAATLTDRLTVLGGDAIVDALRALQEGELPAVPQHPPGDASAVTYARKLSKDESPLDFSMSPKAIVDRIRAFDPWPGCSAVLVDASGSRRTPLKIWGAVVATDKLGKPGEPAGSLVECDVDDGIAVVTADGVVLLTELQKPGGRRLPATALRPELAAMPKPHFEPT